MNQDFIITYYVASTVISVGAFIYLHDKIKTMKRLLNAARMITENTSEHDAQAIKMMKRRFNVAHDEFFGVGHPTRQINARSTAVFDA